MDVHYATPYHDGEPQTSTELVTRLLRAQFPQWAELPVAPPQRLGTSNAIFQLGEDLSVRMPRTAGAQNQIRNEERWLPLLAPGAPIRLPTPLAVGAPGEGYPYIWAVHSWLPGRAVDFDALDDPCHDAGTLAGFMRAIQAHDTTGGPSPLGGGSDRGAPLATRDARVRVCVDELGELIDREAVLASWEASIDATPYDGPGVWIHGDLCPGNLIEDGGRITAAIDFGSLNVGDPACELLIAWNLFRGASRDAFREAAGCAEDIWLRGRGWALSCAVIGLPYYMDSHPPSVAQAWHVLREVLGDVP